MKRCWALYVGLDSNENPLRRSGQVKRGTAITIGSGEIDLGEGVDEGPDDEDISESVA